MYAHIAHTAEIYKTTPQFNNIMSAQPLGPLNPEDCIFSRGEGLTPTPPTCLTIHTYGAIYMLLTSHPKCCRDGANVIPVTHTRTCTMLIPCLYIKGKFMYYRQCNVIITWNRFRAHPRSHVIQIQGSTAPTWYRFRAHPLPHDTDLGFTHYHMKWYRFTAHQLPLNWSTFSVLLYMYSNVQYSYKTLCGAIDKLKRKKNETY